jgi:hypothetical protein
MILSRSLVLGWLLGPALLSTWAGDKVMEAQEDSVKSATISQEIVSDNSFVGPAKSAQGNRNIGSVTELQNHARYVVSTKLRDDVLLRVGVDFERFSFGLPNRSPLPNTLQSTSLIVGADYNLNDQWTLRLEAAPGVYSDFNDISFSDVNAPITLGAAYAVNKDLQWFFGINADFRREYPVLPGVGVRWKFADQWTLMLLIPKPQIQYAVLPNLNLFLGADLKGGTYKVDQQYGTYHQNFGLVENRRLNNATVSYQEVRVGGGATWKINPAISLEAESGAMVMRTFDFYDQDFKVHANGVAPYGRLGVKAEF